MTISPEDISRRGTESGEQKALFAWAAMVTLYGFRIANTMQAYDRVGLAEALKIFPPDPVPDLAWLHAIPNGGLREARTAALIKAEGARKGIADVFLPIAVRNVHGLYIEMKNGTVGKQSLEQKQFEEHCTKHNYSYVLCRSWKEAATIIQGYITSWQQVDTSVRTESR